MRNFCLVAWRKLSATVRHHQAVDKNTHCKGYQGKNWTLFALFFYTWHFTCFPSREPTKFCVRPILSNGSFLCPSQRLWVSQVFCCSRRRLKAVYRISNKMPAVSFCNYCSLGNTVGHTDPMFQLVLSRRSVEVFLRQKRSLAQIARRIDVCLTSGFTWRGSFQIRHQNVFFLLSGKGWFWCWQQKRSFSKI